MNLTPQWKTVHLLSRDGSHSKCRGLKKCFIKLSSGYLYKVYMKKRTSLLYLVPIHRIIYMQNWKNWKKFEF
jgi:hypothetical protein